MQAKANASKQSDPIATEVICTNNLTLDAISSKKASRTTQTKRDSKSRKTVTQY
jgi:hypothetical protein